MARGAVYFHPQFRFHDNQVGEKRFVILNDPVDEEPYLVAKTTTNLRNRIFVPGCNRREAVFFVPEQSESALPLATLIQLFEFFEFTKADLLEASLKERILEYKGDLSPLRFSQLVNCVKKLKHDIPQAYFEMITRP
jgi:hypothetical protein